MERMVDHIAGTVNAVRLSTPILAMEGADAQDLLQRMSTNDLIRLNIGDVAHTIFTNEKGRIVDVVAALRTTEKRLLLVGQATNSLTLIHWIEKFIIMEDVQIGLVKNYSHEILWGGSPEFDSWQVGDKRLTEVENGSDERDIMFAESWGEAKIIHHLQHERSHRLDKDVKEGSVLEPAFDAFRVRYGIPWMPNELSVETNPLETGLRRYVSFTKGCFIGQEVIARLDTYDKVRQRLVRFRFAEAPPFVPIPVSNEGGQVGRITTIGSIPEPAALGFVGASVNASETLFWVTGEKRVPVQIEEIGAR